MLFSIWIGKLLRGLTRLTGGGGSALPGYVIQKIDAGFLKRALDKLPRGVIIVTGTNGKTTTTKIISDLLAANNLRVLTNRSGGNFVRGIISTIIKRIGWLGQLPYDVAVFEQDEAYAVHFVEQYRPTAVVALNVGRDQLDRFGEIDKTAELIGQVVAAAKNFVVLNANDSRIAKQRAKTKARTLWFGHDKLLAGSFASDDQLHSKEVKFFEAAKPNVSLINFGGGAMDVRIKNKAYEFKTMLRGGQNALNVTAALTTVIAVEPNISTETITETLASAHPAFGRGELIQLKSGGLLKLQLVKNPASFSHNLLHLESEYQAVGIAINDDYADGRDVSWLWDVDFKALISRGNVYCGGSRAYDMAVRLKYDEVKSVGVETELAKFLKEVMAVGSSSVIFCTYTAMLKLRKLLKPYAERLEGGLHG